MSVLRDVTNQGVSVSCWHHVVCYKVSLSLGVLQAKESFYAVCYKVSLSIKYLRHLVLQTKVSVLPDVLQARVSAPCDVLQGVIVTWFVTGQGVSVTWCATRCHCHLVCHTSRCQYSVVCYKVSLSLRVLQAKVSVKRINDFLCSEELDFDTVSYLDNPGMSVCARVCV